MAGSPPRNAACGNAISGGSSGAGGASGGTTLGAGVTVAVGTAGSAASRVRASPWVCGVAIGVGVAVGAGSIGISTPRRRIVSVGSETAVAIEPKPHADDAEAARDGRRPWRRACTSG